MRVSAPHQTPSMIVTGHFREGPGYTTRRPRGTDDWLLILTVSGLGRCGFPGREIVTEPGDVVLYCPGAFHDYGVEGKLQRWELLWTHFHARPHWLEFLRWPEEFPGLMRLRLAAALLPEAARRLGEAHQVATGGERHREMLAMNRLEDFLLWCDACNPRSQGLDPRVRLAMDHVCRRLQQKLSLESLSAAAGLSVSRLAHLFRQQVGMTPQHFVETQRLDRAKQLLELTPRTIQTIAYDLGFENPFYFTLRFKRYTGLTPTAYRRRYTAERRRPG
jgi:AraC family transcriptional regulator, arabinose operon regulatory protein